MKLAGVLLFLVGCYTSLAAICPTDWQRYGESCYLLITQRKNWHDANDACLEHQRSTLAVANSKMEQAFIWIMFNDFFKWTLDGSLWIGCNDINQEGEWQPCPLRNDSTRYNNWGSKYPRHNTSKNCAIMGKWANGKWFDVDCNVKRNIVCELPVDDTTPVFCLQTGSDGRVESQCLVAHVMKELRADGVVSCGKACRSEPRCRSFNLLMEHGPGKMVCQLNNATRHEASEDDMYNVEKCYFSDL